VAEPAYDLLVGVGGIGTGMFFALEGDHTLGRNESRPGRLLDVRDYCKLHIIAHYFAMLAGAGKPGRPRVLPVGFVGNDAAGRQLVDEMRQAGMDVSQVRRATDRPTLLSVCFQYPDGTGGNITTSNSAAGVLAPADVEAVGDELQRAGPRAIALAAPEVPLEARARLLELATQCGAFRAAAFASAELADAQRLEMFEHIDLLAINEDEAAAIAGEAFDAAKPQLMLDAMTRRLRERQPGMRIIVSAGAAGAFAIDGDQQEFCPSLKVEVASTAGAGDALLGGTLAGLCMGLGLTQQRPLRRTLAEAPLATALDLGVLLAALSVTSPHTIAPAAADALPTFAARHGLALAPPLADALATAGPKTGDTR
jgi:sugar/nucleoside kinase (ribokinase family)